MAVRSHSLYSVFFLIFYSAGLVAPLHPSLSFASLSIRFADELFYYSLALSGCVEAVSEA